MRLMVINNMRQVNFRGKTFKGEWVYGCLSVLVRKFRNVEPGSYISNSAGAPFAFRVMPETICQFIGLVDIDNVKVYDGDRLQMFSHSDSTGKHEPTRVWKNNEYRPDIRTVQFQFGTFCTLDNYGTRQSFLHMARPGESYKVVGNIHDAEQKSTRGVTEKEG